jgi:diguanylate cyclase (GGDEF)-like protein
MLASQEGQPLRILIIDDEQAVHDAYRQCFRHAGAADEGALSAMATELFGDEAATKADATPDFEVVHTFQGMEGVDAVAAGIAEDKRFAVAFIDVRMPPGIDGKETAKRIRALDPDINLVIVTGYSDFSPIEIAREAGPADKLFYIAKPFDVSEVLQTATALASRWQLDRELAATRAALAEKVVLLEEQSAELAANESHAIHMAMHDSLTEAPNRLAFQRALTERARSGERFATAMVDLDRFKLVNDTLGHLAGDELIRQVCAALQVAVPANGMVARLGGDEFGVLFDATNEDDAVMACERVLKACATTHRIVGATVESAVSVGVVMTEGEPVRDPVDVMRRADLALNEAKRQGRGCVRLFDDSMDESIRFRREIESGLGKAIARRELKLVYQPIVAGDRFEIVGFEALLRWNSPEYGPISPAMFIPIAEESNLIHALGDWVLHEALAEVQRWPGQYVSINFSPRQFRRPNFVCHLLEAVQQAGVTPERVQIEITETAIFDDADRAAETLFKLRQMGFGIALDDFGTGYSSLYNIRTFALDALKIDRSFIDGMGRERESAAIVHSIIHLGRALGIGVVAEGVETEAQVQALRVAGCGQMQGYYFARPLVVDEARELAEERFMADEPAIARMSNGTDG